LIVDDELDITSSLKIGLECNEDDEFKVDTFNDSIEALSNYKTGHYDLLLLDVNMPKMDGFDLYHELKK
jgi:two-component system, OmpR family, response regulator ChvI